MSNETDVEQEIQDKGLTAPRLTPALIDELADGAVAEFAVLHGVLTVCALKVRNGFTVTGISACASPENFDKELGEKIARANARGKLWELEGYLLREKLATADDA